MTTTQYGHDSYRTTHAGRAQRPAGHLTEAAAILSDVSSSLPSGILVAQGGPVDPEAQFQDTVRIAWMYAYPRLYRRGLTTGREDDPGWARQHLDAVARALWQATGQLPSEAQLACAVDIALYCELAETGLQIVVNWVLALEHRGEDGFRHDAWVKGLGADLGALAYAVGYGLAEARAVQQAGTLARDRLLMLAGLQGLPLR